MKKLANFDLGADLFKDLALECLVQSFAVFLTTAGQDRVSAIAILLPQNEQLAILDDDGFNRIAQFLLLFHFDRILPQFISFNFLSD